MRAFFSALIETNFPRQNNYSSFVKELIKRWKQGDTVKSEKGERDFDRDESTWGGGAEGGHYESDFSIKFQNF